MSDVDEKLSVADLQKKCKETAEKVKEVEALLAVAKEAYRVVAVELSKIQTRKPTLQELNAGQRGVNEREMKRRHQALNYAAKLGIDVPESRPSSPSPKLHKAEGSEE